MLFLQDGISSYRNGLLLTRAGCYKLGQGFCPLLLLRIALWLDWNVSHHGMPSTMLLYTEAITRFSHWILNFPISITVG